MIRSLTRRMAIAIAATAALLGAGVALAQTQAPFGPDVGTRAPQIGTLKDQAGQNRTLSELAGRNGTVVLFYRSADWCPFCQAQLIALNEGVGRIEQRGYKLVGISYDDPSALKAFTDRRGITYTLLSDPGSTVINRWNLRDPQDPEGSRAYGVPRPIIFVIGNDGVIKASLAEESYRDRPPVDEVVAALDALN